jgi:NTP pyrophosphatase (non-canonical NTP hydrolase)
MKKKTEIQKLTDLLIKFRDARNWKQFHNSKDLALALSIEAAELNELFLWKEAEDVDVKKLQEELADVLIFAFLLAAKHNLSIKDIVMDKIRVNEEKYPIEKARDTARKYNEL